VAEPTAPGDDELARQLEEELRRLKVSDLLVQTVYSVSSLGYRRLMPDDLDLDQARLAIDALGALVPVLDGVAPPEVIRDFNQVKANMQLAYASAVAGAATTAPEPEAEPEPEADAKPEPDA
jgi:hypothetical protein